MSEARASIMLAGKEFGIEMKIREEPISEPGPKKTSPKSSTPASERNISLFKSLILIAKADGTMAKEELALLSDFGKQIGMTDAEIQELIDSTDTVSLRQFKGTEADRRQFLASLCVCAKSDGGVADEELRIVEAIGKALELDPETISEVIKSALA